MYRFAAADPFTIRAGFFFLPRLLRVVRLRVRTVRFFVARFFRRAGVRFIACPARTDVAAASPNPTR